MCDSEGDQLRSARAVRLEVESVVALLEALVSAGAVDDEEGVDGVVPLAPIVLLPVLLPVLPAAVLPPAGVPVVPMGVVLVLCWPAPTAGSFTAGLGGLP
jgi:hypothetical protein